MRINKISDLVHGEILKDTIISHYVILSRG